MLQSLIRGAWPNGNRVRVHNADARSWQPPAKAYDLVVSHFFLDCLETAEIESLAHRVRGSVADDAIWIVSEFAIPPNHFGQFLARPLVAALYRAFGLLTGLAVRRLPDYASALSGAGFHLAARRHWLGGLLVSDLWRASGPHDPQIQPFRQVSGATECYSHVNITDVRSRQT
jgi:hypothetical protein